MNEEAVPEHFAWSAEGTELPLRLVTEFEVTAAADQSLQPLHILQPGQLVLTGQLVAPHAADVAQAAALANQPVITAPLVDWVVEHSPPGQAFKLWAVSPNAWYKLLEPSSHYAPLFKASMQAAAAQVEAKLGGVQRRGGGAGPAKSNKASFGAARSKGVRFAGGAATGSAAASVADLSVYDGGELNMSDGEAVPEDSHASDPEADEEGGNLGRARRRAWQRVKYLQRRAAEEQQQRAEAEARAAAEAAADAARGLPPEPNRTGFRVPPVCLPDLLMVWEFTQAFSEVLQLPPCSLTALEAAVYPGPRMVRRAPVAPAPAAALAAWNVAAEGVSAAAAGTTEVQSAADQQQQQQQEQQLQQEPHQQRAVAGTNAQAAALAVQGAVLLPAPPGDLPLQPEQQPALEGVEAFERQFAEEALQHAQVAAQHLEQQGAQVAAQQSEQQGAQVEAQQSEQAEVAVAAQLSKQQEHVASGVIESGRPPRAAAGSWMRHASEDFIVDEPAVKLRRQSQQDADSPPQAPLRFKVSVSSAKNSQPLRRSSAAAAGAGEAVQQVVDQAAQQQAQQLQEKYGLTPEAARRLVPLDRDYAPSGALLRDVCCALLRVAFGKPNAAGDQPRAAKLQSEENENPLPWPERVCNAVWQFADADYEDRAVAIKLGYGDFQDLSVEERVRLLSALVRLALGSEQMQAELNNRLEAYAAARRIKEGIVPGSKDVSGPGDEDSDAEAAPQLQQPARQMVQGAASGQATPSVSIQVAPPGDGSEAGGGEGQGRAGSEAPSASTCTARSGVQVQVQQQVQQADKAATQGPATAADWAAWLQQRRMGLRRPLGMDLRGRRYWCFGRQAGAFRIYVEDLEGQMWGWYEGEQIIKLQQWLEQATVVVEAPLLRALRSVPLPRASGRQQRQLAGTELDALRPDGYRTLAAPFLRGEWNTSKVGLLAPAEQRIQLAVDALLGAVPVWFKGREVLQQHLAICEAIQGGNAADMGRALLSAEKLLADEGRLSEEWADLWQLPWSRAVSACGDFREMLLYTAALQQHVHAAPDLLPRQAFLKYAIEAQCPLFFPYPGENVAVMRVGLLRHIDRYMQLLGLARASMPPSGQLGQEPSGKVEEGAAAAGNSHAPEEMEVDGEELQQQQAASSPVQAQPAAVSLGATSDLPRDTQAGALPATSTQTGATGSELQGGSMQQGEDGASQQHAQGAAAQVPFGAVQLAPTVQESKKAALQTCWDGLRQRALAMRPVERYTVRSVVYRRHLADNADLEHTEADDAARRWPVAWLILRPASHGPLHRLPTQDLVIPVAIDNSLPEYVIKAELYTQNMRVLWQPGDRFRMFFGGQVSRKTHKRVKTGGAWYKGTVLEVKARQPSKEAPFEEKEAYDPFETLVVQWDRAVPGEAETVSPWEVEVDPEEERRRTEEARRMQAAAARAARARQSLRRSTGEDDDAAAEHAEQLQKQAERSVQLLSYHQQEGAEEESTFNEAVHGKPLQLHNYLMAPAAPLAPAPAVYQQHQYTPAAGLAAPVQPLYPGQEVSHEILDRLRPLSSGSFITMIANFYRGLKGRFKVPIFAHHELDLYTVFWAVMERGGYETVTGGKQWKEICRCLPVDLTGQTSASFNMRLNYERCLLDFESYLACGQYERDLAAGRAPETDFLTDPARTRFSIPGLDYSTPVPSGRGGAKPSSSQGSDLPTGGGRGQRQMRGSSRLKHKSSRAADSAGQGQDDFLASLAAAFQGPLDPNVAGSFPVLPVVDAPQQGWPEGLPPMPLPAGAEGAAGVYFRLPPGEVGQMLRGLGPLAVGRVVQRFWEEEGGWWTATISDYNTETGQHRLTYNPGAPEESFEWADLADLKNEELRDMAVASSPAPLLPLPSMLAFAEGAAPGALPDVAGAGGFAALLAAEDEPVEGWQEQEQQQQQSGPVGAETAPEAAAFKPGFAVHAAPTLTVEEVQAAMTAMQLPTLPLPETAETRTDGAGGKHAAAEELPAAGAVGPP